LRAGFVVSAALAVLAGALFALARRCFVRYVVEGASMAPALADGDYVVVDTRARRRPPSLGAVVLARDPRDRSRVIAKRVADFAGRKRVVLLGDNPAASTDSRTFGPVRTGDLVGRVVWRYWPPERFGACR